MKLYGIDLRLLGHRNWIVAADMAFPLMTHPGIRTQFVDEDLPAVAEKVARAIESQPHVRAKVYRDAEIAVLGSENWAARFQPALVPHGDLLLRLDETAKLYPVYVIKTRHCRAYTSVFFELDCGYWSDEKERDLRNRMRNR
ncbi:MAG: hypothetical protein HUU60_07330 [Armatimonadetes bacterium]|nr:hypothetical protein [Armatimonadota bacterium]